MACENFQQPHRLPRDNIRDWASLPNHLLDSICELLFPTAEDYTRFSAVCTHWRSVAGENLRQRLPLLLFPGGIGKERRLTTTQRMMGMPELRPPRHERFHGCCYGWWIISSHGEVCLFHPFSLKTISFPPLKRSLDSPPVVSITLRGLSRCTGVLSGSPDTDPKAYVLMVIYGLENRLAFIRSSGDQDWTYIDHINEDEELLDSCISVNYCKGLFYALRSGDGEYGLLCIDVKTGLRVEKLSPPPSYPRPPHWIIRYLVKSYENGEEHLLQVLRKLNPNDVSTQEFHVYKLGEEGWVEVESLGDVSLFLGQSHSVSWVSTPRGLQLKPNCIYFYDVSHVGDVGRFRVRAFDLKDRSIQVLNHVEQSMNPPPVAPPIWTVSSLI